MSNNQSKTLDLRPVNAPATNTIDGIPIHAFISSAHRARELLVADKINLLRDRYRAVYEQVREVNAYYARCKTTLDNYPGRITKTTREKLLQSVPKPKSPKIPDALVINTKYAGYRVPRPPYPPRLKQAVEDCLLDMVANGISLRRAGEVLEISPRVEEDRSKVVWFCGKADHEIFANRLHAVTSMIEEIHEVIDTEPDIKRAELKIKALMWESERILPRYTPKRQQSTDVSGTQVVVLDFRKAPTETTPEKIQYTDITAVIEESLTPPALPTGTRRKGNVQ